MTEAACPLCGTIAGSRLPQQTCTLCAGTGRVPKLTKITEGIMCAIDGETVLFEFDEHGSLQDGVECTCLEDYNWCEELELDEFFWVSIEHYGGETIFVDHGRYRLEWPMEMLIESGDFANAMEHFYAQYVRPEKPHGTVQ